MALVKNKKQKDNLSKFSYDVAKIVLAVSVIGPLAKPEQFNLSIATGGLLITCLFLLLGYMLDAKEF